VLLNLRPFYFCGSRGAGVIHLKISGRGRWLAELPCSISRTSSVRFGVRAPGKLQRHRVAARRNPQSCGSVAMKFLAHEDFRAGGNRVNHDRAHAVRNHRRRNARRFGRVFLINLLFSEAWCCTLVAVRSGWKRCKTSRRSEELSAKAMPLKPFLATFSAWRPTISPRELTSGPLLPGWMTASG